MRWLLPVLSLLLLSSCEGTVKFRGKVVSVKTDHSIAGASIELLDIPPIVRFDSLTKTYVDSVFISDENGLFTVRSRMVGMVFGLPEYRIRISKQGYQTREVKVTTQTVNEFVEKKDSVYYIRLMEN